MNALLRRDLAVVTMMAITMTLSAFSVYQATRAADEAQAHFGDARLVEVELTRLTGSLETLVANDSAVLAQLCASTLDREVATARLLDSEPDIERFVTATVETDVLQPLVRGDQHADCVASSGTPTPYRVASALGALDGDGSTAALAVRAAELRAHADAMHARENVLITLGLIFIVLLAVLIIVDQLRDRDGRPVRLRGKAVTRWRAALVVASVLAGTVAAILLVIAAVDTVATLAVIAALALATCALWFWNGRSASGTSVGATRPRWWAEVLGAVALVTFTASAVALSSASIDEREATARADLATAAAERLQEHGLQEVARALSALTAYADAEAAAIATAQLVAIGAVDPTEEDDWASRRVEIDRRLTELEDALRSGIAEQADAAAADICQAPMPEGMATTTAPADLYYELSESDYVGYFVSKAQWQRRVCDAVSAMNRQESGLWAEHKSTLTVSLVVLGLSGFMLGLASGKSRTRRASVLLMVVGAAGTVAGLALTVTTLPDMLWRQNMPDEDEVRALAVATATAQTDCMLDVAPLEEAIDGFDGYGPAHEALGGAYQCQGATTDGWTLLGAEIDDEALDKSVAAYQRAEELGPVTPTLQLSLGFSLTQWGIVHQDESAVRRGLGYTDAALRAVETAQASGMHAHLLRGNRALALAALGEDDAALEAYGHARACLAGDDGGVDCGASVTDRTVEGLVVAWTLADLELLVGAVDDDTLDEYRLRIVAATDAEMTGHESATLSVYPQEMQVATFDDQGPQGSAAIVWYHRTSPRHTWAVVAEPTEITIHPGAHLQHPIPARMLLPGGEYRADVYTNGTRTEYPLGATFTDDDALARYESQRMGVSVVVPDDWWESWDTGVHWHLGPDDWTGLSILRQEYVSVEGADAEFLTARLDEWVESEFGSVASRTADDDPWLMGFSPVLENRYQLVDGSMVQAAAALAPYGRGSSCGASLIIAGVGGAGIPSSARDLLAEMDLERPTPQVPAADGRIEGGTFAVTVPAHWDAVVRPAGASGTLFMGKDCGSGQANVLLSQESSEHDVARYVDDALADFGDARAFPGFALGERAPVHVAGADEAEMISYSWQAGVGEVRQTQVYARAASTITFVTVTVTSEAWESYAPDVDAIVSSLEVR